ncbi:serine rich and transmembrane domain containing 1 [Pygocentrus nattereri]|uniref:Serine rich and transmembrane domain containing 1 n=1 Tax=Pygocentrus nattereri TaxID=42514 RepID=A0A3B4E732_PYGNA|nr:serine rich and transmembrane domain containing 1 [Pygocentrus nattereri]
MSGMGSQVEELNGTDLSGESFVRFSPTSLSTGAAAATSGRTESVYIYVSIFLSLLFFLLTLLIIALHRLKNIISSSSSFPECSSEAGSSFTNMEICSLSSQRSTVSSLSC